MEIVDKMLKGDRLALARLISYVEDRGPQLPEVIDAIYPHTGNSFILGITGPPGAGKSTVTDKLVAQIRKTGKTVAVIAIDPSSPFTGGAILGDRIRMQAHHADPGVYIRSLGTRGRHGGLSRSSKEVTTLLDAAKFDWIIVETVGVGQTELDILKLAHAICVVLVPESGDSIQVMKAGLMEIADLFVVNKCDRPESDKLVRELVTMVGMNESHEAQEVRWPVPTVKTQAVHDQGIDELFLKVKEFQEFSEKNGLQALRRAQFVEQEVLEIITSELLETHREKLAGPNGKRLLEQVIQRKISPYAASEAILSQSKSSRKSNT